MFNTIIFLLVIFIISLATHLIIRSKLNIEKQYIYEPVNKIDKYGGIAILVIGLVAYAIAEFSNVFTTNSGVEPILYLMLINGFLLSIFRTFMQWKYKKESKRYILWVVGDIYGVIMLLGILFVFPLA